METVLKILTTITTLLPAATGIAPLVQKAASGQQFNDADIANLRAIADALDAQIEAQIAATANP
jgi:hypothetical protein